MKTGVALQIVRDLARKQAALPSDNDRSMYFREALEIVGDLITNEYSRDNDSDGEAAFCAGKPIVQCSRCRSMVPADTAHVHQNSWIGECCWDERLRSSE